MKKALIFVMMLAFAAPAYAHPGIFYIWVDQQGTVNLSNVYENIPPSDRDRVVVKEFPPESATSPQAQEEKAAAKRPGAGRYGRDETWQTERSRYWSERLREATERYDDAFSRFVEKAEEISRTNFFGRSRTQTKWDVMELGRLNDEKEMYLGQMMAARQKLEEFRQ